MNKDIIQEKTFEDFLEEKHAEQYEGFKEEMSYDFEGWLVNVPIDDVIKYADEFSITQHKQLISDVIGVGEDKKRKRYKEGSFLEHRDEYNNGYNQSIKDYQKAIREV